jgi:hypothetical protein
LSIPQDSNGIAGSKVQTDHGDGWYGQSFSIFRGMDKTNAWRTAIKILDSIPKSTIGLEDLHMSTDVQIPSFEWEISSAVPGGYYDIVTLLRDGQGEIMAASFRRTDKSGDVPPTFEQVRDRANEILLIIRRRYSEHRDKETWLRLTYNAARNGTLRADAQPDTALADFEDIEQMLIDALHPMRTKYLAQLFGSFVLIIALTGLIHFLLNTQGLGAQLHLFLGIPGLNLATWMAVVNGQIATLYGLAIGILFSGIVHNRVISKESLRDFDPDGFSTPERLLYVWVAATTLEMFLWFDAVTIGVGSVLFNDITAKAWIGSLIGLVTSLATEAIVGLSSQSAKAVERRNA